MTTGTDSKTPDDEQTAERVCGMFQSAEAGRDVDFQVGRVGAFCERHIEADGCETVVWSQDAAALENTLDHVFEAAV